VKDVEGKDRSSLGILYVVQTDQTKKAL